MHRLDVRSFLLTNKISNLCVILEICCQSDCIQSTLQVLTIEVLIFLQVWSYCFQLTGCSTVCDGKCSMNACRCEIQIADDQQDPDKSGGSRQALRAKYLRTDDKPTETSTAAHIGNRVSKFIVRMTSLARGVVDICHGWYKVIR